MKRLIFGFILFLIIGFSLDVAAQERVDVKSEYSSIVVDYYYGKRHVSRYRHFLSNHPRSNKYLGVADFYDKRPPVTAWLNKREKVVIVKKGKSRYYRDTPVGYFVCTAVEERLVYWRKRLNIDKLVNKEIAKRRERMRK